MRTLLFIVMAIVLLINILVWLNILRYWIKRKQYQKQWRTQYLKPGVIWRIYLESDNPFLSRVADYEIVEVKRKRDSITDWVLVKNDNGFEKTFTVDTFLKIAVPFEESNKPEQIEIRKWLK